jgi:RimJ/RimL family protein N-acetyltransferase
MQTGCQLTSAPLRNEQNHRTHGARGARQSDLAVRYRGEELFGLAALSYMKFLPLDTPGILELAASWIKKKENYQWLDFGSTGQPVTPTLLKILTQSKAHFLRVYTSERDDNPVGIVALNGVDRTTFKTATFWGAAGDKSFRSRGYGTLAASRFMTIAFRDLGLYSVNTWVADGNPSLKIIERAGFRFVGRQRQCHYIDGRTHDRLLFDLLASEHKEYEDDRWHRIEDRRSDGHRKGEMNFGKGPASSH